MNGMLDGTAHFKFEGRTRTYKRNEFIFRSGDTADGIYCLIRGVVKLESFGPDGQGHILRVYQDGDLLGYRAWIAKECYRANAIAQEDSEISWVAGEKFADALSHSPELAKSLLNRLSMELASAEARICALTDKDVKERVAEALLFLENHALKRQWTRKEISEWVGTTPESVMRTLSEFEKNGLIQNHGRKIVLLDALRLRRISHMD
jgi:CRP-like cAMP-binding protein